MPDAKAFEKWFEDKYPDARDRITHSWELAAVKSLRKWGEGREVSKADFDEATTEACGISLGGGPPPTEADVEGHH